jgi:hypothetical protein
MGNHLDILLGDLNELFDLADDSSSLGSGEGEFHLTYTHSSHADGLSSLSTSDSSHLSGNFTPESKLGGSHTSLSSESGISSSSHGSKSEGTSTSGHIDSSSSGGHGASSSEVLGSSSGSHHVSVASEFSHPQS